jgi:uncharacterized protein (DUF58 family)
VIFTWRARALVLLSAVAAAVGVLLRQEPLALSGLAMLLWIGGEWLRVRIRVLLAGPLVLSSHRTVAGQKRRSLILVIDRDAPVEVTARLSPRLAGLRMRIEDVVPGETPIVQGSPTLIADLHGPPVLRWQYTLRPAITGALALPGLHVAVSDPQGLFRVERFVPLPQQAAVWPFLVRPQTTVSVLKRQNVQLLPGTHRYRKPGISTELLGIRDYRSGDPPRSIAWKATARLGKLMTREYETEAPVRATVLTDLSPAQYLGRPGPARADRIIAAGASIARLLLADGDPVAALIVSASDSAWLPHGLGERHLARLLLRWLAFAPSLAVETIELNALTRIAWTCAFRRHPELFDPTINDAPTGWLSWRRRHPTARQRQQLSFALAVLYEGGVGLPMRLQYDDPAYRRYCRRLLEDHAGTVDPTLLLDAPTAPPIIERQTTETICRGLLAGAARANDNELFVVIGSLPEEATHRERLLDAVRVTRAQHHRVMVIDVGPPPASDRWIDPLARQILAATRQPSEGDRFAEVERALVGLGAKVARLDDARLLQKVASEIEILQLGRTRAGASQSLRR